MGLKKRQSLYETWYHMILRCYNPDHHAYLRYGGRGIRVCDRYTDTTKLPRQGRGRLVSQGFLNLLKIWDQLGFLVLVKILQL